MTDKGQQYFTFSELCAPICPYCKNQTMEVHKTDFAIGTGPNTIITLYRCGPCGFGTKIVTSEAK